MVAINITLLAVAILYNDNVLVISSLGKDATTIISKNGVLSETNSNLYLGYYADKRFGEVCHCVSLLPPINFNLQAFLVTS